MDPAVPPVTPGRITSLWLVLRAAAKYPGLSKEEIARIASATSLRGGGLPIKDGIRLAELSGLLEFIQDHSKISRDGARLLLLSQREEPTPSVIRMIAFILVDKIHPLWTAFSGPSTSIDDRIIAIPEGWQEVMEDAGLLESPIPSEAQEWWDAIYKSKENLLDELRSKIGRMGEELTIVFEKARLEASSRRDLAGLVKWVSDADDRFGFDVASYAAGLVPEIRADMPILIEVKSSASNSRKRIAFELTRNEWEAAERNEPNYFFYFWHGISPGRDIHSQTRAMGPFILRVNDVRSRIPADSTTEQGRWTNCHIELDVDEIYSHLVRPESILEHEDVRRQRSSNSQ